MDNILEISLGKTEFIVTAPQTTASENKPPPF